MEKTFLEKFKNLFKKKEVNTETTKEQLHRVSLLIIEEEFESDELVESAKDLKYILEYYGQRKKQNHRYKGREFMYFLLSNKHKDKKNIGYKHWQNINQIIQLNQKKVYPYHKQNLRKAIDFFAEEIKGLKEIKFFV